MPKYLQITFYPSFTLILQNAAMDMLIPWGTLLAVATITVVSEWKQIVCLTWKKCLSILTFPIYMLTYIPITIAALCTKTTWKPIPHGTCLKYEHPKHKTGIGMNILKM